MLAWLQFPLRPDSSRVRLPRFDSSCPRHLSHSYQLHPPTKIIIAVARDYNSTMNGFGPSHEMAAAPQGVQEPQSPIEPHLRPQTLAGKLAVVL